MPKEGASLIVLRTLNSRLSWFNISDPFDTFVWRRQSPCRRIDISIVVIRRKIFLFINIFYNSYGTIKKPHDKCTNEEKRGKIEENCTKRGTAIIMLLAVSAWVTFSAFTHTIHANSSALALPDTFFDLSANDLHIPAVMLLYRGFFRWWNCPFDLKSASIACEILGKFELFTFNISLSAATRKRAILICWFI